MPLHFPCLLDPTLYSDYPRRPFKAPTWATFDGVPQFTTLRDLGQSAWREDLIRYTEEFKLGRVIWPTTHFLYAPNVNLVIEEIRKRKLFLFDLWSYVPGSPLEGMWSNITPPAGMVAHLEEVLGDRFLGMDNGEQDGRYTGYTARPQCSIGMDRPSQYRLFQRHFQKLCDELGNHMTVLVSLCFGHYFLKEGNHALIGAETAQALPNSQIYYSFIRGAGKQYGIHWFGNASVFNRWGFKSYDGNGVASDGFKYGPEYGASLSLLKRLIYSHYLYNCVLMGFETSWLHTIGTGATARYALSPVGRIQQAAAEFVERRGQPGVMHTPVALLLDFHAGWTPPRHYYTHSIFQVWGALPYAAGDYLTHGVLSMLYPGYEDSGFYQDERGFMSPTPFGDIADSLLTDVEPWVLRQYGLVIAAGQLTPTVEIRDRLRAFVEAGGHLVVTSANADGLVPGLQVAAAPIRKPAGSQVIWKQGERDVEPHAFDLAEIKLPDGAEIRASCDGLPTVASLAHGKGRITLLASPFGLNAEPLFTGRAENATDKPLSCPWLLLAHVRRVLSSALRSQQLFQTDEELTSITCRQGPGRYTLGIFNNQLTEKPLHIESCCGRIKKIEELALDQSEKGQLGYRPPIAVNTPVGSSAEQTIAGGDVRLYEITVEETGVVCLPAPQPAARPVGRYLSLRSGRGIQEEILNRPTFFQHFDGVKVDWTYLRDRDRIQLGREQGWLSRQQVRIMVDFSTGLDLFPTLTLLDNYPPHTQESRAMIDDVLDKMKFCGARDAVMTLHRAPENYWGEERTQAGFIRGVQDLAARAAGCGVTLHFQGIRWRWAGTIDEMLKFILAVDRPNVRLALNTGHLDLYWEKLDEALKKVEPLMGLVLLCGAQRDLYGQRYDAHTPVHQSDLDLSLLASCPVPMVFDGIYSNWDEEYRDVQRTALT